MKTTIDLPDELFRRAKAIAALRGESLKQLITESLEKELNPARLTRKPQRRWCASSMHWPRR